MQDGRPILKWADCIKLNVKKCGCR